MKKKYAPEIRMNGFDVDWEKKKLSAVSFQYDTFGRRIEKSVSSTKIY